MPSGETDMAFVDYTREIVVSNTPSSTRGGRRAVLRLSRFATWLHSDSTRRIGQCE